MNTPRAIGSRALRLLDLFSGAGGASMGYSRAGFREILGVDIAPQPRYPFEFRRADALEFLADVSPGEFDLIHASPPCQGYSRMRHLPWLKGRQWPLLIEPLRAELQRIGTPYVIENVAGAPLVDPVMLCGRMFGLKIFRHRLFECSEFMLGLPHQPHTAVIGSGRLLNDRRSPSKEGFVSTIRGDAEASRVALGCPWMTRDEVCQAVPPVYTEWLGRQLREVIG
jgi:DNA (cytosine-5)-methyltransferase 1